MGQDYSYTQPSSSSDEFDLTSLLEAEAALYADEGQSSFSIAEPVDNPPEADDGIPTRCYCGSEVAIATSYTRKDPGRLYYTCENRDDVTEEVSEVQREVRLLKEQGFHCDQKLLKLQKTVCDLKKNSKSTNGYALEVCVMVSVLAFLGLALMFVSGKYHS
ncbi:hypothetical protein Bca4012_096974 [Brassica carinata]